MANLYTQTQVYNLAKSAGFSEKEAEIAAAISMAESLTFEGGKQYADFDKVGDIHLMDNTWGASYGAFQVRSLKAELNTGKTRDASRLPDPIFNTQSAYKIFVAAGRAFTPWSTFKNGAYLGYMQQAVYNPKPQIPSGEYLITGGDTLSKIAEKTGYTKSHGKYAWQLIAAINNLKSPYTIYPGQVIKLPDWKYTVQGGDTLTKIATEYSDVTWQRIAEYNSLENPNALKIGQVLLIPRYTSWDGKTLN